jgi:serine phosphatase RsbU (regulator of sigma subunit)
MDIALIRINETTITYSAANRPLWIIKKDTNIIEEIKATKHAIAGFTEDNFEFEEHSITLNKGDSIYLFTDGYADQFGGNNDKKLTTKRFKDYLLQIKDKPMSEQQKDLDLFVKKWKGNTEQVDDILVIGIRL